MVHMLQFNIGDLMKDNVLKNLLDMHVIEDADIIIRYNTHYANHCLDACKGLDDCVSVLIDSKFISDDEVKNDIIDYYQINFKNNANLVKKLISVRLQELTHQSKTL